MINEEVRETELSLVKTNRVCKAISVAMKIAFALLGVWWLVSIGVMVCDLVNPDLFDNVHTEGLPALVIFAVYGCVLAVICVSLIRIFSDASQGKSPFTMQQVRRLRFVAGSLLVYAVLEFAISLNASFMQQDTLVATVNVASFVASAVVFAFSFVFKYGVLLQELSDETL